MKIVIFADSIRPFEHITGLATIAEKTKNHKIIFISKSKSLCKKINIRTKNIPNISNYVQKASRDIFLILSADILFGSPDNWRKQILRFTSMFMRRRYSIHLRPGKVTKPSGFLSFKRESLGNLFTQFVSYKIFNTITLVADKSDMFYCKSAYSKPFPALKIFPSPKLFAMSQKKVKRKSSRDIVLFSPTHRNFGERSPLDNLLLSEQFLKKLQINDLKFAYTTHPSGFKFDKTKSFAKYFDGDWSKIKCVVTDYSSIGADFSLLGGNVIYYIPDVINFFSESGEDFFFKNEIKDKILAYTQDELINKIKKVKHPPCLREKEQLDTYFDNLYRVIQE